MGAVSRVCAQTLPQYLTDFPDIERAFFTPATQSFLHKGDKIHLDRLTFRVVGNYFSFLSNL